MELQCPPGLLTGLHLGEFPQGSASREVREAEGWRALSGFIGVLWVAGWRILEAVCLGREFGRALGSIPKPESAAGKPASPKRGCTDVMALSFPLRECAHTRY